MAISKLLYFILLIVSAFFYILYSGMLSAYILIFIISLPIFLGICILCAKLFIRGDIKPHSETAVKNSKINFSLYIRNKTPFPFSNSIITIEYFNSLMNVKDKMTISIPIHPLCSEKINFSLTSDYCGMLNIRIKSIQVFDFIKLFSVRIKPQKICKITVLPEIYELSSICSLSTINSEDSDIFSKHKSGDDPSEIFALKSYIQGDKPNRIHWNLSLKHDDIIVRHYSQPISSSTLIVLDFCGESSRKQIRTLDAAAETAFSVSMFLTENEIPFKYAYFNIQSGHDEIISVSDSSVITGAFKEIFLYGPAVKTDLAASIPETANDYSKIIYITTSSDNVSEISNKNTSDNLTLIFIKNEYEDRTFDFEKSGQVNIISAEKLEESISNILI